MAFTDCEKCEERKWDITCSCSNKFCEPCFPKHLSRNPGHRQGANKKSQEFWRWASGKVTDLANSIKQAGHHFKEDEAAKWFGVHTEVAKDGTGHGVTSIVETGRLGDLTGVSLRFKQSSPRRQFPSITSFVGDTGAGKSTLIRSLMFHSPKRGEFDPLEAPVVGAEEGSSAIRSTTGEVNLYLDPTTFGGDCPVFYADCEGMLGTEPLASQHQKEWMHSDKRYLVETKDGKPMDRSTAVTTLYPRFLYIFSDVVCYVTRNHRAWADSAVRLLEWSLVGAQGSINQHSLPALIIILNGPAMENESWVSDDLGAATRDFFAAIEQEIEANVRIRELAKKHGDKSMQELFARSFSSVHVHYIPLYSFGTLGTSDMIMQQTHRLAYRIRDDTSRVQARRAEAWTRFDTRQLLFVVEYAFKHIASGTTEPFDFSKCRQQLLIPLTAEQNISEFLSLCLGDGINKKKFNVTAAVLGCSILRRNLRTSDKGVLLTPDSVFDANMQAICSRAVTHFLDHNLQCAFTDVVSREKCVNTKIGHAAGHQSATGQLLKSGLFVHELFDSARFVSDVKTHIRHILQTLGEKDPTSRQEWRRLAAEQQQEYIDVLRSLGGYPHSVGRPRPFTIVVFSRICHGCLFGRPEYSFPCEHSLCATCLEDFDQTDPKNRYPGLFLHKRCVTCAASSSIPGGPWPRKIHVRPDLAGLRVLALDGGGVRGIVELTVLARLEERIGLDLPIGRFFDFIIGTSAGGIIALGVGVQGRSATNCVPLYRSICRQGFKPKTFTKAPGLSWLARWVRGSIYQSNAMEFELDQAFESGGRNRSFVFGIANHARVAITTTVGDDGRLIANYNRGDSERYIPSTWMDLTTAARCTSAAPMYFEPETWCGYECRDGGLKHNNPIQLGVDECKEIWHPDVGFDVILSVGSGRARKPQQKPASWKLLPTWLGDLFNTLMSTMDGEAAWKRFRQGQDPRTRNRGSRLNVKLTSEETPALDDISKISALEGMARRFDFGPPPTQERDPFGPIAGFFVPNYTLLDQLADQLRASMYFFQLVSIRKQKDIYSVTGWIGCRIDPEERAFTTILQKTNYFRVKGRHFPPPAATPPSTGLQVPVEFNHQDFDDTIRIDVNFFFATHDVSISGFPLTLRSLLAYWDAHEDDLVYRSMARDDPATARPPTVMVQDSDTGMLGRVRE